MEQFLFKRIIYNFTIKQKTVRGAALNLTTNKTRNTQTI